MPWLDLGWKKKREGLAVSSDSASQGAATGTLTAEGEDSATPVESVALGRLARLEPFSRVAVSLMRQLNHEDSDYPRLARLISSDTALAAETLAMANSPLFGMRQDVKNIVQALAVLGTDRMRSLATTLAMRSFAKSAPNPAVVRRLWRHSIATAVIARELAPVYTVDPELAHTAGVLHDVGRMGLLAAYREVYAQVVMGMYEDVEAILHVEYKLCGIDHCDAGVFLSNAWQLPKVFERTTGQHHRAKGEEGILGLIGVACKLADDMYFPAIMYRSAQTPSDVVGEYVPEDLRHRFSDRWHEVEQRIAEKVAALDF